MFRKFMRNQEILCPVIYAGQHTTSPGQTEDAIIRNDHAVKEPKPAANIYDKARRIYFRGQRNRRSRSASIL